MLGLTACVLRAVLCFISCSCVYLLLFLFLLSFYYYLIIFVFIISPTIIFLGDGTCVVFGFFNLLFFLVFYVNFDLNCSIHT